MSMTYEPGDPAYPRDLVGYGRNPPHPRWPDGARIAVQIVINYEEGGENCLLHGDRASEAFLSEIVGAQAWPGQRHMNMESIYEYGSRAGFWRLWRMFTQRQIPVTVYGVATAMARNPDAVAAMHEAGWEIASHGYKWIDYRDFERADEEEQILAAIRMHQDVTGQRPLGFYQGRTSENTLDIVMREGGFLYGADSYADELPYWVDGPAGVSGESRPFLIVPYTLDANDMRFATPQGFNAGDQFFSYLKDSFDTLYEEGAQAPRMFSIGLHCRLVGRPGRAAALARFLDYAASHEGVWFTRRLDIARHWLAHHAPEGLTPSRMNRAIFVERFGDIFEHSPWVARAAWRAGLTQQENTAQGLHRAMVRAMREGDTDHQLALIRAHPDLAGRLHAAELTADSAREQSGAGLDRLSQEERATFLQLNDAYKAQFGFPFIMAVKGRTKDEILAAFRRRMSHDPQQEFNAALMEIEAIALLRLRERLPSA
jgi:OHCU decarboxylase